MASVALVDENAADPARPAAETMTVLRNNMRGSLLDLGARRLDDRRQPLLLGGAEGHGVGRAHPDLGGALLIERLLHGVCLERLLRERRELLDHRRRHAGWCADAAPHGDLVAR